jgi:hypothetical protein
MYARYISMEFILGFKDVFLAEDIACSIPTWRDNFIINFIINF